MRRVLTGWPATDWVDEVQARLDRLQIERAARDFTVAEQTPLAPAERALLQSARRMAASNRDDEAIAALSELVRSVPSNPEPWGALGKIHRSRGDHAEAEVAFIRAISAAPNAAEWHANLGDLLVDSYGGKRDREARDAYRTALSLRPTWTEVAYRVAEMERGCETTMRPCSPTEPWWQWTQAEIGAAKPNNESNSWVARRQRFPVTSSRTGSRGRQCRGS